jgi:hypothetical protein
MTDRKATATAAARMQQRNVGATERDSRFPEGMTERKAITAAADPDSRIPGA